MSLASWVGRRGRRYPSIPGRSGVGLSLLVAERRLDVGADGGGARRVGHPVERTHFFFALEPRLELRMREEDAPDERRDEDDELFVLREPELAFFAALLFRAVDDPALRPPLRDEDRFTGFPRPDPLFLPPPVSLLTVAQARASASSFDTPVFSYPSSMCSACRFCLSV